LQPKEEKRREEKRREEKRREEKRREEKREEKRRVEGGVSERYYTLRGIDTFPRFEGS
jgi:CRISPR/Cas system-associated endonuclease Cas1